ncbi:uncharacterized protein RAG0_13267 [Rhynchosporium agropyri]|uniref:Uncharacterized protein n=1 Tax=Rhynchosporium agropyri TaxID=914238 RepID=A0A1E1LC67_9HELO|nr:uncharacterized protein RAG0_13267 [Rhynchosporium agropyri]
MHRQTDIQERIQDIKCPKGREIKETGWCRLKDLCGGECRLCDQLIASTPILPRNYPDIYAEWRKKCQGSIYDLGRLTFSTLEEAQPDRFPIEDLPTDLWIQVLRVMLVSEEPITNPHLQNENTLDHAELLNAESGPTNEGVIVKYNCFKYLRPNLMATSKRYWSTGMQMLYGQNTFRFTRLIHQAGRMWLHLTPHHSYHNPNALDRFLTFKHCPIYTPEQLLNPTAHVNRSFLLQKVIIEGSDLDNDFYAKRGVSQIMPRTPTVRKYAYLFHLMKRFMMFGGNLTDLTITIDEEEPEVLEQIAQEEYLQSRPPKEPGVVMTTRDKYGIIYKEQGNVLETTDKHGARKVWNISSSYFPAALRLSVDYIHVRGTSVVAGGDVRFLCPGSNLMSSKGIPVRVTGSYAPTSRVARALVSCIAGYKANSWLWGDPTVSFTGRFNQRRLRDDGTYVSDDKLEAWVAKNAQEALEQAEAEEVEGATEQDVADMLNLWPFVHIS